MSLRYRPCSPVPKESVMSWNSFIVCRLTTAVTGPPSGDFDRVITRVIGGSGSPPGYSAVHRRQCFGSTLPPHHFVDPDRGEWRCASFGTRIVAINPQLFTDRERSLAVFGEVDADCRKAAVHRPLHF